MPSVLAALDELPEPMDLVALRRDDGEVELVPRSWRTLHIGAAGPSFLEKARRTPGGLGLQPQVREAVEYAERLLRLYHSDFDTYAARTAF